MVPPAGSSVPPALPTEIPRLALSVKLAVVTSVPPLTTNAPGVAKPGAAPRLLSAEMLSLPELMIVPPE